MRDLFKRSEFNPVLSPDPAHAWESKKVYNPGAIFHDGKYHLFYRATGIGNRAYSVIGYAVSRDGEHFERFERPILDRDPQNPFELRGLEDPRVMQVGDTFFMAYAAYDGIVPRLCIASSKDWQHWVCHGPAFTGFDLTKFGGASTDWDHGKAFDRPADPEYDNRTKAGGIFPEKIDGKYWMLFNEFRVWLANSDDGIRWDFLPEVFIAPRKGTGLFDNVFVEMGPPPIKTEKGWLVLYHGVNDLIQYHLGVMLLDLNDPRKVIYRADEPIFGPREPYELSGIVDIIPGVAQKMREGKQAEVDALLREAEQKGFMPQVTFTTGAVVVNGIVRLFYGAGDVFICTATALLADILATIP
jgi:predicted GH43/DUF377 family glycosyl hydrolase